MALAIEIDRDAFEHALFGIQTIAQRRAATPVLANVRLDTVDGGLRLYATDYDVALTRRVAAEIREPGSAALPARLLYEIVRKAAGDRITLEVDAQHQGTLRVAGTRSRYKLMGIDPAEFPEPTEVADGTTLVVDRELFAHWIKKTIFAAVTDESRAALAGVFAEMEGDRLRLVATDTHRLALMEVPGFPEGSLPAEGVILPRKALLELLKIVEGDGELELRFAPPFVEARWADNLFLFRTVEGRFPSYRTVIPDETGTVVRVDRSELLAAIDRVSIVVTDRYKGIMLDFASGVLTLVARNPEMGEGEEQLDCVYEGRQVEIGFNAQYLTESLAQIAADTVEIDITDPVSPVVLHPEGDRSYLNVIMPMRL